MRSSALMTKSILPQDQIFVSHEYLALAVLERGKVVLGVLAVVALEQASVSKDAASALGRGAADGLVLGAANLGAALAQGLELEQLVGVLAVVQIKGAGVREGAKLAVHGLGTDEVLVHGAHHGAALAVALKGEQILGVLAVVDLELARVVEDLEGATGGLGADGVVICGADVGALGRSGGGRDRQEDSESDGGLDEHVKRKEDWFFIGVGVGVGIGVGVAWVAWAAFDGGSDEEKRREKEANPHCYLSCFRVVDVIGSLWFFECAGTCVSIGFVLATTDKSTGRVIVASCRALFLQVFFKKRPSQNLFR